MGAYTAHMYTEIQPHRRCRTALRARSVDDVDDDINHMREEPTTKSARRVRAFDNYFHYAHTTRRRRRCGVVGTQTLERDRRCAALHRRRSRSYASKKRAHARPRLVGACGTSRCVRVYGVRVCVRAYMDDDGSHTRQQIEQRARASDRIPRLCAMRCDVTRCTRRITIIIITEYSHARARSSTREV